MTHSTVTAPAATSPAGTAVLGWDIGGSNTKATLVVSERGRLSVSRSASVPLEMARNQTALVPTLRRLAADLGPRLVTHAVTMTAELSRAFRTKRDGVEFVLDALAEAFPGHHVRIYAVDGRFLDPATARARPLEVAAANWAARSPRRRGPRTRR
jgi:uncharacterized hydantoinase/oxoprolinase family protein